MICRIALGLAAAIAAGACDAGEGDANGADAGAGVPGADAALPAADAADPPDARPPLPEFEARYHSFEEVEAFVELIAERNPGHVALDTYGESDAGRALYVIKFSDDVDTDDPDEPDLLLNYSIHGDEIITVEAALWLMHALAESYGRDPRVTALVDSHEIYVAPVVSPDSFVARRRRVDGVDPNRNFPWDDDPNRTSIGIITAARDLYTSRDFAGTLDYHAFGQLILLPFGGSFDTPANFDDIEAVGRRLGEVADYRVDPISTIFGTTQNGGSVDYYHWKGGGDTINIGIELTTSKSPPASRIPEVSETAVEIALRFVESF